jgi:hypothetical protein
MAKHRGLVEIEDTDTPVTPTEEISPTKSGTLYAKSNKTFKVHVKRPLNIRSGPGFNYEAVGMVVGGTRRVFEESAGWGRIGEDKWINISPDFVERA